MNKNDNVRLQFTLRLPLQTHCRVNRVQLLEDHQHLLPELLLRVSISSLSRLFQKVLIVHILL